MTIQKELILPILQSQAMTLETVHGIATTQNYLFGLMASKTIGTEFGTTMNGLATILMTLKDLKTLRTLQILLRQTGSVKSSQVMLLHEKTISIYSH